MLTSYFNLPYIIHFVKVQIISRTRKQTNEKPCKSSQRKRNTAYGWWDTKVASAFDDMHRS